MKGQITKAAETTHEDALAIISVLEISVSLMQEILDSLMTSVRLDGLKVRFWFNSLVHFYPQFGFVL